MPTPKQRKPNWRTRSVTTTSRERHVSQFALEVVSGPDRGVRVISDQDELAIGTSSGNQLILTDGTVSRHHCQIVVDEAGFLLRDLGSKNGTTLGGHLILAAFLSPGSVIGVGQTTLRFLTTGNTVIEPLADQTTFGGVIGESPAMRHMFFVLNRIVGTDATVLLEGETGTGKTTIAEAIHNAGARSHGPFVVVDCAAISGALIESELFGHERGAFTGATEATQGLFEAANHGTIFLDEVGELPLDLQPKLLRVLEGKAITRIGSTRPIKLDVRIIAATNRDLRAEVNDGKFRSDLYFRISALRVHVPALRERSEDLPRLVQLFYRELAGPNAEPPGELLATAMRYRWPGNVRELRNFVERNYRLGVQQPDPDPTTTQPLDDLAVTFREAKARALIAWERAWIGRVLQMYGGNVSRAARATQMDRNHLRDLIRRYGLHVDSKDP